MFDSLRGIKKERDVQERELVALDYLLEREEKVRKEWAGKISDKNVNDIKTDLYSPLYQSCQNLPSFTASDLQALISAKANNGYDENESRALGLYTSVLLHLLTEREQQQGRRAEVEIDLQGGSFSYLFYFAGMADIVQVKNVVGKCTCAYMGSFGGRVQELYLTDCEGNYAAWTAGRNHGKVGTLMISGNKGNWAAIWVGGNSGKVGTLVIDRSKGNHAARRAGSDHGHVGTLVISGNEGDLAASKAGSNNGKIGTLALYNAGMNAGFEAQAERILTGDEALQEYQRIMRRKELLEILQREE